MMLTMQKEGGVQNEEPLKSLFQNWDGLFCYGGAEADWLFDTFWMAAPGSRREQGESFQLPPTLKEKYYFVRLN